MGRLSGSNRSRRSLREESVTARSAAVRRRYVLVAGVACIRSAPRASRVVPWQPARREFSNALVRLRRGLARCDGGAKGVDLTRGEPASPRLAEEPLDD